MNEADELATHIITTMQEHDQLSALDYKFPYFCRNCDVAWQMNFYDIMRLTERDTMPCGCPWGAMDFRRAIGDMVEINKPEV